MGLVIVLSVPSLHCHIRTLDTIADCWRCEPESEHLLFPQWKEGVSGAGKGMRRKAGEAPVSFLLLTPIRLFLLLVLLLPNV